MLRKAIRRTMLVGVLIVAAAVAFSAAGTTVRSVRTVPQGDVTAVIVEADGPLPRPRVGVLDGPPRIYLDFAGVKTATSGTYSDVNAPVQRVRVALNQAEPLVTRVVLDLAMPVPHRIDATLRDRGQVTVLVGPGVQTAAVAAATAAPAATKGATASKPATDGRPTPPPVKPAARATSAAAPSPPVPAATPTPVPPVSAAPRTPPPVSAAPPAPPPVVPATPPAAAKTAAAPANPPAVPKTVDAAPAPAAAAQPSPPPPSTAGSSRADVFLAFASKSRASAVRAPAKDIEKYLQKAAPAIERIERARPILVSLDAMASVFDDQLTKAIEEFESIRRMLSAIEPPRTLDVTHELLRQACTLAVTAATARADSSVEHATRASTAASAAAGALMLIERARADLGLLPRSGS